MFHRLHRFFEVCERLRRPAGWIIALVEDAVNSHFTVERLCGMPNGVAHAPGSAQGYHWLGSWRRASVRSQADSPARMLPKRATAFWSRSRLPWTVWRQVQIKGHGMHACPISGHLGGVLGQIQW